MSDDGIASHLRPEEEIIVLLEGVVAGYTRWSGLGGILAVVSALTVPRVFGLGLLLGAVSIVVVVTVVFLSVYYAIGRRLAASSEPPVDSPYLMVVLTDRRVLIFDRGLGGEDPVLVDDAALADVAGARHTAARPLVPQLLEYYVAGQKRGEYEFARRQPVQQLVAGLD